MSSDSDSVPVVTFESDSEAEPIQIVFPANGAAPSASAQSAPAAAADKAGDRQPRTRRKKKRRSKVYAGTPALAESTSPTQPRAPGSKVPPGFGFVESIYKQGQALFGGPRPSMTEAHHVAAPQGPQGPGNTVGLGLGLRRPHLYESYSYQDPLVRRDSRRSQHQNQPPPQLYSHPSQMGQMGQMGQIQPPGQMNQMLPTNHIGQTQSWVQSQQQPVGLDIYGRPVYESYGPGTLHPSEFDQELRRRFEGLAEGEEYDRFEVLDETAAPASAQAQAPTMTIPPKSGSGPASGASTDSVSPESTTAPIASKKSFWLEISPAVAIATLSVGFLIVHQKESIETFLSMSIAFLFSFINMLTLAGTGVGCLYFVTRLVLNKSRANALAAGQASESNQTSMSAENAAQAAVSPHDYDHRYMAQTQGPNPAMLYEDHAPAPAMHLRSAPAMNYFPVDSQAAAFSRSYSQPVIPQVLQPAQTQYGQMPVTAPTAARMPPPRHSVYETEGYFQGPHQSHQQQVRPFEHITHMGDSPMPQRPGTQTQRKTQKYSPPASPQLLNPFQSGMSDFDDQSTVAQTPFQVVVESRPSQANSFVPGGRRLVFRRQEAEPTPPPVADEVQGNHPSPPEDPTYHIDDFACKPYGAPPKRYHGVNV